MKKVLLLVFVFIFSINIFAQQPANGFDLNDYGVKIEPDKRLMVVIASLEAAGLDTPLTADGEKFRQKLKNDLLGMDVELRRKMTLFVEQYKKRFAERYKQNLPEAERKDFTEFLEKYKQGLNEDEKQYFYKKYKKYFTELTAPFISMAYTLAPAPDLSDPIRATDLPGDLLEVLDFAPLVREFYRKSYSVKIDEYTKDYLAAGDALRPTAREMVGDLLDYLHTKPQLTYIDRIKTQSKASKGKKVLEKTEIRERARQFYIVPELLAPKDTINFRNVRDEYFAIVPPNTDLSQSEARRAYLQFVIDPLVLSNGKDISTVREPIRTLLDARRAENADISPDVFLAVTRSLVAAIDARQIEATKTAIATDQARQKIDALKTDAEKKSVSAELAKFKQTLADETVLQLADAYEKGAVLSFYFADQLKGFEDSGFDIAGSLRDFILSLDAAKEANRLAQNAETRKRAVAAREERRKNAGSTEIVIENPVTKRLLEIDALTKAKNYTESEKQLKTLLAENSAEPRVYYALGRVASLSAEAITETDKRNNRLLEAKNYYTNVITSSRSNPDAALLSLTYVALARIYKYFGEDAYAIQIYDTAIKIGDVSNGAYKEAVAERSQLTKSQ